MKPEKTYKMPGSEGVDIQLAEWPGSGPAVLGVHGLTANLHCYQLLAEALAGQNRVLAMDIRGRGLSDKPDTGYSLEKHCQDIAAVIKGLGLKRISLMGHSLGAYICLAFAAGYPQMVDKLVLLDGGGELSSEQWAKVNGGIKPSVDRLGQVMPDREAYLDMVRQAPYFNPWNQTMADYFDYEVEAVQGGVRSRVNPDHIEEERENLRGIKPSSFYRQVLCPVLIVRAGKGMLNRDDVLLPTDALERMLREMDRARVVDLPDADHFTLMFQPNPRRDQALREFLAP
ncbi:MAG: alpha/beta hydrolase [Desulfarculaceae bacterium]|nr:alpha/beta hydrolase [Desulfarculaceae bacterium]MCF8046822.1 alpha/beta hydrolase [Desulfarculaceae bacterium]MCF8097444.1 alpha/beta hydrolase [Desulfarculaceae bacterium]MCF8121411.1 alpha/beta hydrolase [Desulfarculaceae bacterium]